MVLHRTQAAPAGAASRTRRIRIFQPTVDADQGEMPDAMKQYGFAAETIVGPRSSRLRSADNRGGLFVAASQRRQSWAPVRFDFAAQTIVDPVLVPLVGAFLWSHSMMQ